MRKKRKKNTLSRALNHLKALYEKMPETKGCMEHINKPKEEGGCEAWCCQLQNPQLLQVEFLHAWKNMMSSWELDDIVEVIEAALKNYLSKEPTKGCIFFDKKSKMCRHHDVRPLACRQYGVEPEEEFKPKYERLKVLYADIPGAVLRDQCDLVSTIDDKDITVKDTEAWWLELMNIEGEIGIGRNKMNDEFGGTYRTYHDHLLLHAFPVSMLEKIQAMKMHGNAEENDIIVRELVRIIKKNLSNENEKS